MQLHSPLSATDRLFQPWATLLSPLVNDTPQDYPARDGLARGSPAWGSTTGLPVRGTTPNHRYSSDEEGVSTDATTSEKSLHKRRGSQRSQGNRSGSDSDETLTPEGDERKRMDFLVRSRSLNSEARRVILMMWLTPLGSGPIVSLITVITMRIPTSCP